MDCNKVNGYTTIEKILEFLRISGDQKPVAIIALTTNINKEINNKYLDLGFSGFLVKPVAPFELKILC